MKNELELLNRQYEELTEIKDPELFLTALSDYVKSILDLSDFAELLEGFSKEKENVHRKQEEYLMLSDSKAVSPEENSKYFNKWIDEIDRNFNLRELEAWGIWDYLKVVPKTMCMTKTDIVPYENCEMEGEDNYLYEKFFDLREDVSLEMGKNDALSLVTQRKVDFYRDCARRFHNIFLKYVELKDEKEKVIIHAIKGIYLEKNKSNYYQPSSNRYELVKALRDKIISGPKLVERKFYKNLKALNQAITDVNNQCIKKVKMDSPLIINIKRKGYTLNRDKYLFEYLS